MIRRIALATAAVTTAALATGISFAIPAGAVTPVAPLPADKAIPLPLGRFTGMVVDLQDKLVFYAGDSAGAPDGHGGGVAVSHLDGTSLANIHGTSATAAITLGPDGKVYATQENNTIAAIDPTTLTVTTHSTGEAKCPSSIAFAGSSLWFTYQCADGGTTGLATIDLATDLVTTSLSRSTNYPPAQIANVPGNDALLAGSNLGGNNEVDLVGIDGASATLTKQTDSIGTPSIAVTPDGSTILATDSYLGGTASYSTADLTRGTLTYPAGGEGHTAAISADASLVATAGGVSSFSNTVSTFRAGSATAVRTYDTSTPGSANQHQDTLPAVHGLAWTGSTLLAVYVDYLGDWPLLKVLNSALQAPTSMTFSAPKTAGRATRITLTGAINTKTAGDQVVITKRDLAGAHTLGTALTDANGKFSFADIPAVGSTNTYVAKFLGDQSHAAVAAGAVTTVSRGTPALTVKTDTTTYNFRQAARISIHLASHDVKQVQLWAKPGPQPLHYLKTLTVDSHGNAVTTNSMVYNTIFVVKFYGDYYYNSRVVSSTVKTKVAVEIALAGNYGTSGAYKLFHAGSAVYQGGGTGPDKSGQCLRFEAQFYQGGSWHNGAVLPCGTIESGVAIAVFHGPAGYSDRVRAVFAGDSYNLGNASGYAYFTLR